MQSAWYQERWPVELVADQNQKTKFETTATGFREAMAARAPAPVDAAQALAVMRLLELGQRSAAEGRTLALD